MNKQHHGRTLQTPKTPTTKTTPTLKTQPTGVHAKKRENAIEMQSLAPLVRHDDVTEEVEKEQLAAVVPQSAHVPSRRTTKA